MKLSELKNKISSFELIFKENIILFILILLIFEFLFLLAFFSESSFGGPDSFQHYFISRYSFKHPHLFVHHWGKPVFTLLSAPFSQFGFTGCKTFNIIVSLGTAIFSYLTVKKLGMKYSTWTILLVIFTPVFFACSFSCLTEPLFGLVIILSIYLLLEKKYIAGSVLISFLLLVRFEGFIVLPLFLVAYIFLKKYKAIPFLLTGFIFYSIIGSIHYNDFFWLITENPYSGAAGIYGKGDLFHYINKYDEITGTPLTILFILGLVFFSFKIIRDRKNIDKTWLSVLFLLLGSCFIYVAAHSWVWWKGTGSSLGLIRVMAGVTPVVAITAIGGINLLDKILRLNKTTGILISSGLAILIISLTLKQYNLPVYFDNEEKTINNASEWIKNSDFNDKPVMFFNPYFCYSLEMDPYDPATAVWGYYHDIDPMELLPVEGIIVWDAHYGPNEAYMPLEKLLKNKNTRLIKRISPAEQFYTLNHYDYEIFIFQKAENPKKLKSKKDSRYISFDEDNEDFNDRYISNTVSMSGKNSYFIDTSNIYSPEIIIKYSEINPDALTYIFARVYIYPYLDISGHPTCLIASSGNNDVVYKYKSQPLEGLKVKPDQWNELTLEYMIPEQRSMSDYTKIYVMHKGEGVYIDDLFIEINEFKGEEAIKFETEYYEKRIEFYENKIRQDTAWLNSVSKKASQKKISLEEMVRMDAIYMFEQNENSRIENPQSDKHLIEERIRYYEDKIRQDTIWLKNVEQKAKEQNISLDEMVRKDAEYMVDEENK